MAGHVIPNPDIFILAIFHRGIPATRPVLKYISHTVAFEIFNNGYGMGPDQSEEMPGLPHPHHWQMGPAERQLYRCLLLPVHV